ncbi:histone-lysine N-methyltransferase SMYD3-like isoform X2 [Paramacrobiotus metropolitanus]|uniref:histone-lysine N-methyltransferase SMYD3-like isoform X2 n=1 Tax=Paramacrobiotus metropolitanus TaxID=2943436 RepID=UPI0024459486|nr:histone-lysine N-methyltransferase SMYD3-like isoform X2 [Paramacrobiotus metropolitanus]
MAAAGIPSGQDPSARLVLAGNVVVSSEPWVWSFNYNAHSVLCAQCFTEIKNLRTCSGCKLYRYCNTECQSVNWKKEHKLECALLKTIHEQLQPFIAKGVFNHDCSLGGCYMFGCCAGEILVAKVLNKIMQGIKEEVSGYTGNVTDQQVLDALSLQPTYPRQANIFERLNHQVCAAIWPSAVISRIPQFEVLVQKLMYNALPILNQRGKFKLQMMGIFPQALQRAMTPVCLDINVTMDLQGRTLVVRAVKDIHYTGLKDLRQNEEVHKSFYVALKERQGDFERFYGFSCACGKCNDKYEAEINPLRCCTVGCPARIPSDVRALQPCPECGADNVPQLLKLKAVMAAHDQMGDSDPDQCFQEMAQSLAWVKELDTVVHPDAHLRFTCGYDIADFMQATMRYEEAWNLVGGMIDCCHVSAVSSRSCSLLGEVRCDSVPVEACR